MFDIENNLNAILDDDVDALKMLVKDYDDATASTYLQYTKINGFTLAHLAIMNNCSRVLDYLLDAYFSTELEDDDGDTLLMHAVGAENPRANDCIDVLLRHHANVQHRNKVNTTSLMIAAFMDNLYAINRLLAAGADVHDRDNLGQSVMSCAVNTLSCRSRGAVMPNQTTIVTLLRAGAPVQDLYQAYCILGIRNPYGAPTMVPLRQYHPSLLYRNDLCLIRINPDNTNLVRQLLS